MFINELNGLLGKVKIKLESLSAANLAEAETASHQNPAKLDGPRKRLQNLYGKLIKGRSADNEIVATGSKRS